MFGGLGKAFGGMLGIGGDKGNSGAGSIAEEVLKRNAGVGGTGNTGLSTIGAGYPGVGPGVSGAAGPKPGADGFTIMSDANGNTRFNPTTGVNSGPASGPADNQGAGNWGSPGIPSGGVMGSGIGGDAGSQGGDLQTAGLAAQGLLQGADPNVISENIRQLRNQGFSEQDAINQALQFAQQR